MALFSARSWDEWIAEYAESHRHPVNRACHTVGIPTLALSVILFVFGFLAHRLWAAAAIAFVLGWVLQLVGHAYERKPPEFLKDWRFLLVGLRWWWAKLRGRA